jgi:integrase
MTAVMTGMRQGEVLGLKWDDIYGHLMKDSNQETATRLGNLIFGESGSNK